MAKNKGKASAKKRQQALKQARKDNKVTAKEAKKLRQLGVSKNRITSTKKGSVKVTPAAKKTATRVSAPKPTPAPSPRPSPRPTPTPTPSRKTVTSAVKQLQGSSSGADKGGNKFLTGKQANQVLKLVTNPERLPPSTSETTDRDGNVTSTTTPGKINYGSFADQRLINKALAGMKKDGNPINNINSENDLAKIANYVKGIATTKADRESLTGDARGSGKYSDISDAYYGDIGIMTDRANQYANMRNNITPYTPEYKALADQLGKTPTLQQYEAALKDKPTANKKDINNFNNKITSVGKGRKSSSSYNPFEAAATAKGKSIGPTVDGIGKASNYKPSEPRVKDIEAEYALIAAELGLPAGLGPSGNEKTGVARTAAGAADEPIPLTSKRNRFDDNPYADLITDLESQISGLNLDIADMTADFEATNTYLSDQAAAASAAFEAAETRATNLANAFTPNANPNANSINYGDYRRRNRRKENNQLSDLAILSDVGNSENPLAGLQLA